MGRGSRGVEKGGGPLEKGGSGGSPPVNVYLQNGFVCITDISFLYLKLLENYNSKEKVSASYTNGNRHVEQI